MSSDEVEEGCCLRAMGWFVKGVFWAVVLGCLGVLGWGMYTLLDTDPLGGKGQGWVIQM